jgi:hypothetical protein
MISSAFAFQLGQQPFTEAIAIHIRRVEEVDAQIHGTVQSL